MNRQQCMGGWCPVREKCAHYWAPKATDVPTPTQNLCMASEVGSAMTLRPVDLQAHVDNSGEMA